MSWWVASLVWGALVVSPAQPSETAREPHAPAPARQPQQPVAEALRVQPGASCLEVERLTAVIVTYLRTTDVDARVSVEVVGDDTNPEKISYTVRRRGEVIALRNFEAETTDCEQLHAVVGVSVALAIDATLVLPAEPEPPKRTQLPPQKPKPPRGEDAERAPQLDARPSRATSAGPSPWGAAVVGAAGVSLDAPPRVGGLGHLAVELQWKDYVDLSIGVLGTRSRPLPLGSGEATFSLVGARADLCGGFAAGIVRSRGCAGLIAGGALAHGEGFGRNETSRLPWVGAIVGLDLRISATDRVAVELGTDGLAHILRPAFDFLDEDGARRLGREFPNFGGWATVGLVVKLR